MMSKSFLLKVYKYVPVLIIMLTFSPIMFTYGIGKLSQAYDYMIYIILSAFVFCYYWKNRKYLSQQYKYITSLYVLMIIYVVASCIKLLFVPSSIYPFQRMQVMCSFLSVGVIFVLMNESVMIRTLKIWWKYVPIIVLPASILMDKFWLVEMLQMSFLFLMLLPIVLFFFAQSGKFNVFDMDSYIEGTYTSSSGENMKDDTRTILYEEAINSALDNNYLWYGRTPGYGYDSKFVAAREGTFYAESGVFPQRNSEVFAVNMFTWTGVIGLTSWFLFFSLFGYKVLKKARNRYIRALVVYVGFFWVCDWISNYFVAPSSGYMLLFMVIAICSQSKYQLMSDFEIETFFKRILR